MDADGKSQPRLQRRCTPLRVPAGKTGRCAQTPTTAIPDRMEPRPRQSPTASARQTESSTCLAQTYVPHRSEDGVTGAAQPGGQPCRAMACHIRKHGAQRHPHVLTRRDGKPGRHSFPNASTSRSRGVSPWAARRSSRWILPRLAEQRWPEFLEPGSRSRNPQPHLNTLLRSALHRTGPRSPAQLHRYYRRRTSPRSITVRSL